MVLLGCSNLKMRLPLTLNRQTAEAAAVMAGGCDGYDDGAEAGKGIEEEEEAEEIHAVQAPVPVVRAAESRIDEVYGGCDGASNGSAVGIRGGDAAAMMEPQMQLLSPEERLELEEAR